MALVKYRHMHSYTKPVTPPLHDASSNYFIGDEIGKGGFGNVYKGKSTNKNFAWHNQDVAIKIMTTPIDRNALCRLQDEVEIHSKLYHTNVVQFVNAFQDYDKTYIVMEHCDGGNLYAYLNKLGRLEESAALFIIYQLLHALDYLHSKNIVHRDVKLANILLSTKPGLQNTESIDDISVFDMTVKLCDFGMSIQNVHPDNEQSTFCGTMNYIPPEAHYMNDPQHPQSNKYQQLVRQSQSQTLPSYLSQNQPLPHIDRPDHTKRDIWAVGVIFHYLVDGSAPFDRGVNEDTHAATMQCDYRDSEYMSDVGRDFLRRQLLNQVASARPTAKRALQHPIFRQCHKMKDSQALSPPPSTSSRQTPPVKTIPPSIVVAPASLGDQRISPKSDLLRLASVDRSTTCGDNNINRNSNSNSNGGCIHSYWNSNIHCNNPSCDGTPVLRYQPHWNIKSSSSGRASSGRGSTRYQHCNRDLHRSPSTPSTVDLSRSGGGRSEGEGQQYKQRRSNLSVSEIQQTPVKGTLSRGNDSGNESPANHRVADRHSGDTSDSEGSYDLLCDLVSPKRGDTERRVLFGRNDVDDVECGKDPMKGQQLRVGRYSVAADSPDPIPSVPPVALVHPTPVHPLRGSGNSSSSSSSTAVTDGDSHSIGSERNGYTADAINKGEHCPRQIPRATSCASPVMGRSRRQNGSSAAAVHDVGQSHSVGKLTYELERSITLHTVPPPLATPTAATSQLTRLVSSVPTTVAVKATTVDTLVPCSDAPLRTQAARTSGPKDVDTYISDILSTAAHLAPLAFSTAQQELLIHSHYAVDNTRRLLFCVPMAAATTAAAAAAMESASESQDRKQRYGVLLCAPSDYNNNDSSSSGTVRSAVKLYAMLLNQKQAELYRSTLSNTTGGGKCPGGTVVESERSMCYAGNDIGPSLRWNQNFSASDNTLLDCANWNPVSTRSDNKHDDRSLLLSTTLCRMFVVLDAIAAKVHKAVVIYKPPSALRASQSFTRQSLSQSLSLPLSVGQSGEAVRTVDHLACQFTIMCNGNRHIREDRTNNSSNHSGGNKSGTYLPVFRAQWSDSTTITYNLESGWLKINKPPSQQQQTQGGAASSSNSSNSGGSENWEGVLPFHSGVAFSFPGCDSSVPHCFEQYIAFAQRAARFCLRNVSRAVPVDTVNSTASSVSRSRSISGSGKPVPVEVQNGVYRILCSCIDE